MQINAIAENIAKIAGVFYKRGDISFYDLVLKSGYMEHNKQITVNDIADILRNAPEYVDNWFLFSENKRTSEGWHIQKKLDKYIVAHFSGQYTNSQDYDDVYIATAEFITKELKEITLAFNK